MFSFDELTILFQKMLSLLTLVPKVLEVVDVYFREEDSSNENNIKVIGDINTQCKKYYDESSFFDLSGCLVVGDIHGNITALLHVSDLIDKMMLPDNQYLN
jgi:hypothetical protein